MGIMLEELRKIVYEANMELPKRGLITYTWGNASGIDREKGLMVIKPSGVAYEDLTPEKLVIVDLEGNVVEGDLNPSSDTASHIVFYKAWPEIGGVVHTHSSFATSWAQSLRDIPCYGTTHADTFYGPVPCVPPLSDEEIQGEYEKETGICIVKELERRGIDPLAVPAALAGCHGPFSWGKTPMKAVEASVILEEVAKMALRTEAVNPDAKPVKQVLLDKHYYRKHGANATYGQK